MVTRFVCFLFYFISLSTPAQENMSFPEKLDAFSLALYNKPPLATYEQQVIENEYPQQLIVNQSLLPQTANYPLADLKRLYLGAQNCQGPWPVHPSLTHPLVFTRAMCFNRPLPDIWFSRSNLIHPGGGSYAARFVEKYENKREQLYHYFHIKERKLDDKDTLLGRLQRMSSSGINALVNGAIFLISGDELWLRQANNYHIYPQEMWQPIAKKLGLSAFPINENRFCLSQIGNVCWELLQERSYRLHFIIALTVIFILSIAGWQLHRQAVKRRLMHDRVLVLQILTHELRTPIASISMTVEGFRRKFDSLPESLYDEFRRLCEDSMRLKQLAEVSKDYLLSNQQQLVREYLPSFETWFSYVCEERGVSWSLKNDAPVAINIYWLTTSLDNLISNAKKYGCAPVQVDAQIKQNVLFITVQDQGKLTKTDWKKIRKPFVSEKGLGLGLTIVEAMIEKMGGKLTLKGPPTTFTLEIPCDASDFVAR